MLELLSLIYPGPLEAVEEARRNGTLRALHAFPGPDNPGVFALIDWPDIVVGYLSFAGDLDDEFNPLIMEAFQPYLRPGFPREVCFNVNGRNPRAIQFVQSLGFRLELLGVKLAYRGPPLPEQPHPFWRISGYQPGTARTYATLLERAYQPILTAMGSQPNLHIQELNSFAEELEMLDANGGAYSFWIGDRLAAACLVQGSYIRDLVVDPDLQNHGLGSIVLTTVVNDQLSYGATEICLDVALNNTGARRFYSRHGFVEISCFADHSFIAAPVP